MGKQTIIKTHCTIVNLQQQQPYWYADPLRDDPENVPFSRGSWYWEPGELVEPSGWDDGSVFADLKGANEYLAPAKVHFELAGKVNVITMWPGSPGGKITDNDFRVIAARIGAQSFTRQEVHVAFIKKFAGGLYRGRSIQSWCYACVERPDQVSGANKPNMGQAHWVLAHELGHLLGLGHEPSNTSRMMHRNWLYGVGHTISQEELDIIKAHAHVDTSATYVPPEQEEPVCRC